MYRSDRDTGISFRCNYNWIIRNGHRGGGGNVKDISISKKPLKYIMKGSMHLGALDNIPEADISKPIFLMTTISKIKILNNRKYYILTFSLKCVIF